ncbi:MAG: type VI secretion system protein ImpH [Myxococcota bacterium]|jgi:type VI secretion system protein ImpH
MASEERASAPSVAEELFSESFRFEFNQAVRLLEQIYECEVALGTSADASHEAVRIRNDMSLAFPPSPVLKIESRRDRDPGRERRIFAREARQVEKRHLERPDAVSPEFVDADGPEVVDEGGKDTFADMLVTFLGVAGVSGPLPLSFTEMLMERDRDRDYAMRDLLDVFNHRIASLLHRVHTACRLRLQRGRVEHQGVGMMLSALSGLGIHATKRRLKIRDGALLLYAGILNKRPAPVSGLRAILQDYFQANVHIEPFQGRWCRLDNEQRTMLGTPGQANELGFDTMLGQRYWDQEAAFNLRIGPMSRQLLEDFLPGGPAFEHLDELVRLYVGPHASFGLELVLSSSEVPQAQLSSENGSRLGWTSWLGTYDVDSGDGMVTVTDLSSPIAH